MNQFLSYCSFDFSSIVVLLIVGAVFVSSRRIRNKKLFVLAVVLLAICLFSPLKVLSTEYLFSAHMVVHVILLLCVGPMLLMSVPPRARIFRSLFAALKCRPVAGWVIGVGAMWVWHLPVVSNTAMSSMTHSNFNIISVIEIVSLIISGALFSSPVIHPNKEHRADALSGVVYLFTACIACSLLGLLITFAPVGTYHHFLSMNDQYGLNRIIVHKWNLTQLEDQQSAGLIMWVPCCLLYVSGAMYLLLHWFKEEEEKIAYSKEL